MGKDIKKKAIDEILEFICQVRYGEVVIKIHDGKVVQIEKKVKKRFNELHEQE